MDNVGIIVISLFSAALILPYLYIRISAALSVGKSVPDFNQLLRKNTDTNEIVYFYFMSERCAMCKSMTPHIVEAQASNPNVILIDINQSAELAKNFHIYGTPTLIAVKDRLIQKVKLGGLSRKKINAFMTD
jgi:thioredoxin-like negative regulator of GroEL